jgi:hypothetical protein
MMMDVVQTLMMNGSAALGAKQRLIVAVFASFSRCTEVLARHMPGAFSNHMTVLEASDAATAQVFSKERLRVEWLRREHWVRREAFEHRVPKKGRNRQSTVKPA